MHAIRTENVELVQWFLDRGAMVNGGDIQWGWTSLHYAASACSPGPTSKPRSTGGQQLTEGGCGAVCVPGVCVGAGAGVGNMDIMRMLIERKANKYKVRTEKSHCGVHAASASA